MSIPAASPSATGNWPVFGTTPHDVLHPGEGAEVRGPVQALLLLLTGRVEAALPSLDGPGATQLAGRAARRV